VPEHPDIVRLRNEYANRAHHIDKLETYSLFTPSQLFSVHQRQQAMLRGLKLQGVTDLSDINILEIGCGSGRVLVEYLGFGALPEKLCGIDLLFNRLQNSHKRLLGSNFINADGQYLPFPSGAFDLVMQYTAISSILDVKLRYAICREMVRITRPGGLILSYDFWLNPTNKQTLGLHPTEIKKAFFDCTIEFKKITLAPPLARILVPISWGVAYFVEKMGIFNSHYLAIIKPNSDLHNSNRNNGNHS